MQTTSVTNEQDIKTIKSQISGLTRMNVMVNARVSGVYNNKNQKSSTTSDFTPEGALKPTVDIDSPLSYTQNQVNSGWNCIGAGEPEKEMLVVLDMT